jgi:hypothetical protein
MTPNQALKQRKQLCREMRATSAAMWRLYSLGIAHIQKACTHKWQQGFACIECAGCGKMKKGAKKK